MFGDKIKLTELDNQIQELERKRQVVRENISKRISYLQFACCRKCKHPLLPLEKNSEYSEVEAILEKHDLECKGAPNLGSGYVCSKCGQDLGNNFRTDKDAPVYRFGELIYCAKCATDKKLKEQELK